MPIVDFAMPKDRALKASEHPHETRYALFKLAFLYEKIGTTYS